MKSKIVLMLAVMAGLLLSAGPAHAQEVEMATQESLNTTFFLLCMALVFLMHAGFAMLETGFTGANNAGNIMMKNSSTPCSPPPPRRSSPAPSPVA